MRNRPFHWIQDPPLLLTPGTFFLGSLAAASFSLPKSPQLPSLSPLLLFSLYLTILSCVSSPLSCPQSFLEHTDRSVSLLSFLPPSLPPYLPSLPAEFSNSKLTTSLPFTLSPFPHKPPPFSPHHPCSPWSWPQCSDPFLHAPNLPTVPSQHTHAHTRAHTHPPCGDWPHSSPCLPPSLPLFFHSFFHFFPTSVSHTLFDALHLLCTSLKLFFSTWYFEGRSSLHCSSPHSGFTPMCALQR